MQRVTITLDDELIETLDGYMLDGGHANRSEAIRDLVRIGLEKRDRRANKTKECIGALVYVYDHETRRLAQRLNHGQHEHHDMSVATLHVHLDAHKCLEVAVLKGAAGDVHHFADHVIGERGVQYGQLVSIPLEARAAHAGHPHDAAPTGRARKAPARRKRP